jgi:Secretion system C-terminal sorting domain
MWFKKLFIKFSVATFSALLFQSALAQQSSKSVLVNFGGDLCNAALSKSTIGLYGNAQTTSPVKVFSFNTTSIGNIYGKFISYNPINNKLYVNNVNDGINSKIYILDIGLPTALVVPVFSTPNYTIANKVLNQFEFDPTGDLYALAAYNATIGTATIGAYDDTTGVIYTGSSKTLAFPLGRFPDDLNTGDIAISPNGRMFAVFGSITSRIYEIKNYKRTATGNATATYLGVASKLCYGLAYENGYMVLAGSDFGGNCYSFAYNINSGSLSVQMSSAYNTLPIDMTSFSPSLGAGMKIVSATKVNVNTYDLVYHAYIQNKGNVRIGNTQLTDNLIGVFGAGNISNVGTSWISNGALLTLNSSFNGGTNKNLLAASQIVYNTPAARTNSLLQISLRVTNLNSSTVYLNSVVISGSIASGAQALNLQDSSNNYISSFASWGSAIDPDNNNVSDDFTENNPTPWQINIPLPVELLSFNALWNNNDATLKWSTVSEINNDHFDVERSFDSNIFETICVIKGSGTSNIAITYLYNDYTTGNNTMVYYRIKQVDFNGTAAYSLTRQLTRKQTGNKAEVYPNPTYDYVQINFTENISLQNLHMEVYGTPGKKLADYKITLLPFVLPRNTLKQGVYFLRFVNDGAEIDNKKLIVEKTL